MGLAASQARFLSLTARKSDIEYKGQQLNQERTINAHNMEALVEDMREFAMLETNEDGDLVNESGLIVNPNVYTQIQADLDQKHIIDSQLELELKNVDTQHQEVQTEIDAVNKVIDKNIDMTFKTFA